MTHKLNVLVKHTQCNSKVNKGGGYRLRCGLIGIPKTHNLHNLRSFEAEFTKFIYKHDHCGLDNILIQDEMFYGFQSYYLSYIYSSYDRRYVCRFGRNNNPYHSTLYFSDTNGGLGSNSGRRNTTRMMRRQSASASAAHSSSLNEFCLKQGDSVQMRLTYHAAASNGGISDTGGMGSGDDDINGNNGNNHDNGVYKLSFWKLKRLNAHGDHLETKVGEKNTKDKVFKSGEVTLDFNKYDYLYAFSSIRCGCANEFIKGFEYEITESSEFELKSANNANKIVNGGGGDLAHQLIMDGNHNNSNNQSRPMSSRNAGTHSEHSKKSSSSYLKRHSYSTSRSIIGK